MGKRARSRSRSRSRSRPAAALGRTGGFVFLEKKFVDYSYDAAVSQTLAGAEADPATVNALSSVGQGDTESQRDGRKMEIHSCLVRGHLHLAHVAGATPEATVVRIALVLDTQTNGAQLNAEDVFVEQTDTDLNDCTFQNLQYSKRFRVLKDIRLKMVRPSFGNDSTGGGDSAGVKQPFLIAKKFKKPLIVTHTTGTSAVITTVTDNSLHLLAWASSGEQPTLRYCSRVRFSG